VKPHAHRFTPSPQYGYDMVSLFGGLRLLDAGIRSFGGRYILLRIDFEEVIHDNKYHGYRAKKDGKLVKVVVRNHDAFLGVELAIFLG
jgi:hypothetical protein